VTVKRRSILCQMFGALCAAVGCDVVGYKAADVVILVVVACSRCSNVHISVSADVYINTQLECNSSFHSLQFVQYTFSGNNDN